MSITATSAPQVGASSWYEIVGPSDAAPPPRSNPRRGTSKYPFDELHAGHLMKITERSLPAVRDAVRRYVRAHTGAAFRVWRGPAGSVLVKRTK